MLADFGALLGLVLLLTIRQSTMVRLPLLQCLFIGALLFGAFCGGLPKRVLSLHWIAIIGGMCCPIYLVHPPLEEVLARNLPMGPRPALPRLTPAPVGLGAAPSSDFGRGVFCGNRKALYAGGLANRTSGSVA